MTEQEKRTGNIPVGFCTMYQDEKEKIADLKNFSTIFKGDKDLPHHDRFSRR